MSTWVAGGKKMFMYTLALLFISIFYTNTARTAPVVVTLLHTNDFHSHFRQEKTPLGLGGADRLKTAVDQIKSQNPGTTLLVDGGDWSEGNIYYNLGTGTAVLKMMDRIGYDLAVLGNHDWINGPDLLLDSLAQVQSKTVFLGANLNTADYPRASEFHKRILPYVIREVGGVKIAFIGITTYEYIYDSFIAPIRITEIKESTRHLAEKLKKVAHAVVVISHNSISSNREVLLAAPDIDLIIGAHDHVKLSQPVQVERPNSKTGWIVEAGCWGQYLGQVTLQFENGEMSLKASKLIQIDSSIPSDSGILADIESLEAKIQDHYGPIFQETIGETEVEFHRNGMSSPMGNLVVDAYRNYSKADFSIDIINFIYGEIHKGKVTGADVFNSNPAVYNPRTDQSWTLKVLPISGRVLSIFLNILFSTPLLGDFSLLNVSGLSFNFDPLFHFSQSYHLNLLNLLAAPEMPGAWQLESIPMVQDILVQGKSLESNTIYRMATGGGLIYAIHYINKNILNFISLDGMEDLGIENWKVLEKYIHAQSPMTSDKLQDWGRFRTLQSDLGLSYEDVSWEPLRLTEKGMLANVQVKVSNSGATASKFGENHQPTVHLLTNKNGTNSALNPQYEPLSSPRDIPLLNPGESKIYSWQVTLPSFEGIYSVTAQIRGLESEVNHSNHEITRFFHPIGELKYP